MTNTDIQEMEQVREHLQLMLQNCKGFNDHQGDYELAPSTTTAGDYIGRVVKYVTIILLFI